MDISVGGEQITLVIPLGDSPLVFSGRGATELGSASYSYGADAVFVDPDSPGGSGQRHDPHSTFERAIERFRF